MAKKKVQSFGVGCFYFSINQATERRIYGKDCFEEMQTLLGKHTNIKINEFSTTEAFKQALLHNPEKPTETSEIQHVPDLILDLDINIPREIYRDILHDFNLPDMGSKKFHMRLIDTYYLPVTIVEPLNVEYPPSSSIVYIREYLKYVFRNETSFLEFRCLGPSPFHAEFIIRPDISIPQQMYFETEVETKKGYDFIKLNYNPKRYSSIKKAKEFIFREITDDLGFYYDTVHSRLLIWNHWEDVEKSFKKLRNKFTKNYFKVQCFLLFQSRSEISRAHLKLFDFKSFDINIRTHTQHLIEKHSPHFPLIGYAKEELAKMGHYPTQDMKEMLDFFDSQSLNIKNISIALISFIVGSVLTLLTIF